jgi:hypothetical protein
MPASLNAFNTDSPLFLSGTATKKSTSCDPWGWFGTRRRSCQRGYKRQGKSNQSIKNKINEEKKYDFNRNKKNPGHHFD